MTTKDAKARIGMYVRERNTIADAGILRQVRQVDWQDFEQRRSIWVAQIEYRGCSRWVPLKEVRPFTAAFVPTVENVRPGTPHQEFMLRMRSLLVSGPWRAESSPNVYYAVEVSVSDLFRLVFGRAPTAAEMEYMLGDYSERCERCQCRKRRTFFPDGAFGDECGCTDQLNAAVRDMQSAGG